MRRTLFLWLCAALLGWPAVVSAADAARVKTDQVEAELLVHAPDGIGTGKALAFGLLLKHRPHWHSYWKNPGDSGLPTRLSWELPKGVEVGEIEWPVPQRLPIGPMVNYGYEGQVLLAVPARIAADYVAGAAEVVLQAEWLVCKEVCIPESGRFSLKLPSQPVLTHAALFDTAKSTLPLEHPADVAALFGPAGFLTLEVGQLPAGWAGRDIQAFAESAAVFDHAAPTQQTWKGDVLTLRLPLSPQRAESPERMYVVLRSSNEAGQVESVRVGARAPGPWPAVSEALPAALPATPEAPGEPLPESGGSSFWWALLLAFGGGILLNLMPCVFPVLSLKVLGFATHKESRRQLALGGLAYTAGVVLSFVALAGLLLALRASGSQLGWGFQLQAPEFVAALALLFTLIGLNLIGLIEFSAVLPGRLADARAKNPALDSALTGVLAVAVASPCTAPFMGVALGVALTQPAGQALAIFASLGLGMAGPYLAATLWPGLGRALPRPGVWMQHFRVLMAFPMFATVIWLLWVLGQQVGIDGVAALLGVLLALALTAWVWSTRDFGPRAGLVLRGLSALLCVAAVVWAAPALREQGAEPQTAQAQQGRWQVWSPDAVRQALEGGHPVFVDFTAAWCVTCQFNKRGALANAEVLADFDAKGVVLMRADWTRRDPVISQELTRLGRSGVPVYLLQKPGATAPRLLPEILSPALLREALAD